MSAGNEYFRTATLNRTTKPCVDTKPLLVMHCRHAGPEDISTVLVHLSQSAPNRGCIGYQNLSIVWLICVFGYECACVYAFSDLHFFVSLYLYCLTSSNGVHSVVTRRVPVQRAVERDEIPYP